MTIENVLTVLFGILMCIAGWYFMCGVGIILGHVKRVLLERMGIDD